MELEKIVVGMGMEEVKSEYPRQLAEQEYRSFGGKVGSTHYRPDPDTVTLTNRLDPLRGGGGWNY